VLSVDAASLQDFLNAVFDDLAGGAQVDLVAMLADPSHTVRHLLC
jgi:hypothetical protein